MTQISKSGQKGRLIFGAHITKLAQSIGGRRGNQVSVNCSQSSIVDNDQSQVSRAEYTRVAQSDSWEDQSEDSEGGGHQQGEDKCRGGL